MTETSKIVPARHGRSSAMTAGELAVMTNPHGNQVVDLWALSAGDTAEFSSMDHTRSVNSSINGDDRTPRDIAIRTVGNGMEALP